LAREGWGVFSQLYLHTMINSNHTCLSYLTMYLIHDIHTTYLNVLPVQVFTIYRKTDQQTDRQIGNSVYTHACSRTHIHTNTHTHTHTYTQTHTHAHTHTHTLTHTPGKSRLSLLGLNFHTHILAHLGAHTYACSLTHIHTHTHARTRTHTHTYTHKHTPQHSHQRYLVA
jgi:hypothetical protein